MDHFQEDDERFAQAAFEKLPGIEPSAQLSRLVAQIPLSHPRTGLRAWWPFQTVFVPAFALGSALLLGVGFDQLLDSALTSQVVVQDRSDLTAGAAEANKSELESDLDVLLTLATLSEFESNDLETETQRALSAEEANR